MRVVRKRCAGGARQASGLSVIIDVFRAFSCQPLFFHFGARRVLLEADHERAMALKKEYPEFILVGEINEVPLEGSDLGNSPSQIVKLGRDFFRRKTVVHRTTAGVTGVAAALEKSEEVVLGSFMTARAVARYIRRKDPELVTLVAMGDRGKRTAPEDEACADYIEHLLTGKPYDPVEALKNVVFQPTAQKFILGAKEYLPREDPIFCLQPDLFSFVLGVQRKHGEIEVVKKEDHT